MTYNYLDKSLINEFRNTINSSPVFYSENELKDNWKFMCAIMDRVDRCVDFINDFNIARINSEASLITFLSYCCILNDSISQLFSFTLKDFDEASVKNQSRFFKEDYQRFMNEYDSTCSITSCSDDKFFEFLRSITFAHPLDTNRPKFMKKDDKLCSPRVVVDDLSEVNMQNPNRS